MNGLFLVWMKQRYNTHTTPLFLLLTIILYIIQFWTLWNKKHLQLPDNRTLWYIFNIYTEQTATITHTTAERIVLVGARNSQDFSEFSMCNVAELYGWEYLKYVPELSKYNNMDTTNNNNNSVSNQKNTNSSVSVCALACLKYFDSTNQTPFIHLYGCVCVCVRMYVYVCVMPSLLITSRASSSVKLTSIRSVSAHDSERIFSLCVRQTKRFM